MNRPTQPGTPASRARRIEIPTNEKTKRTNTVGLTAAAPIRPTAPQAPPTPRQLVAVASAIRKNGKPIMLATNKPILRAEAQKNLFRPNVPANFNMGESAILERWGIGRFG